MNLNNNYNRRRSGCNHGDVFTSSEVVDYMLDLVGYKSSLDLSKIKVLEPSCGEGAFILPIIKRLKESSEKYKFNFEEAIRGNIYAYDIDEKKIEKCKEALRCIDIHEDLDNIFHNSDFLTESIPDFDIIVGNPPYVRYEEIPEKNLLIYKHLFNTLHYRSDLYVLFFEKTLKHLKPRGKHCFICSNRWQKNEYGKKLRKWISMNYNLSTIISLEKAENVFKEEVLAYPDITLIKNEKQRKEISYSSVDSIEKLNDVKLQKRKAPISEDWSIIYLDKKEENYVTIQDLGFKIGIGVATGADNVFISSKLPLLVEQELLLPSINSKDLQDDEINWNGNYLLNPYNSNGKLIDLENFPKASKYLNEHKSLLSERHIAKKNPEKWFQTIDKIYLSLVNKKKILLPDISKNDYILIDEGNFYPLHNLYYITHENLSLLQILSAFLMSDFIKTQLYAITNCMKGGYPRWQSQYLKKLLLPDITNLHKDNSVSLITAYKERDLATINNIVKKIIDSPLDNVSAKKKPIIKQLDLDFI